jgi:hypothetical protein
MSIKQYATATCDVCGQKDEAVWVTDRWELPEHWFHIFLARGRLHLDSRNELARAELCSNACACVWLGQAAQKLLS